MTAERPEHDDEKRVRSLFITYESTDDDADTFMVVLGSIAENFKGVHLVDYQDDTLFAEGEPVDAMSVLHQLSTAETRLTPQQREELESFTQQLSQWNGDPS
jgi:hypothetical protein